MQGLCGYRGNGWVVGPVTDHVVIAVALTNRCRKFAPDVQPLSGVFVDFLVTDFDTDILDNSMTDVIDPEVCRAIIGWWLGCWLGQWWKVDFKEKWAQQVGLTRNQAADALAKIGVAIELDGNGLDGEGSVTAIDVLEEGELGFAGEINILAATGYELQKCGCRHCPYWDCRFLGCACLCFF